MGLPTVCTSFERLYTILSKIIRATVFIVFTTSYFAFLNNKLLYLFFEPFTAIILFISSKKLRKTEILMLQSIQINYFISYLNKLLFFIEMILYNFWQKFSLTGSGTIHLTTSQCKLRFPTLKYATGLGDWTPAFSFYVICQIEECQWRDVVRWTSKMMEIIRKNLIH